MSQFWEISKFYLKIGHFRKKGRRYFFDNFSWWDEFLGILLHFNPISHKYGPLWPIQLKSVHHFIRFWTIDTKIHDFVSFDVCQVPVKPFLTFFQKYLKNLASKNFGGPQACGEKLKNIFFFRILKKMLISLTEFEFHRFSPFF